MKVADIATVILVAAVSTIAAALTVNALLGDPNEESVEIKYMEIVESTVARPDEEVFNLGAVNPTVEVYVGKCESDQTWDEEAQECRNSGESKDSGENSGNSEDEAEQE